MKFMYRAAAFAIIFAITGAALLSATAATPQESTRIWLAGGLKQKGEATLSYSTPESDDIGVVLSCKRGAGSVKIFLSETNEKLKPGKPVTLTWSVGAIKSSFSAKLMPNEEAGVPSADGVTPLSDPVISQLKGDGELVFTIDKWSDRFPLKGIGEEGAKFMAACSK